MIERRDVPLAERIHATARLLRASPDSERLKERLRSLVAQVRPQLGVKPSALGLAPTQLGVRVCPRVSLGKRLMMAYRASLIRSVHRL